MPAGIPPLDDHQRRTLEKLQGNDDAWQALTREFAAYNPLRFIQACASCMDQLDIQARIAVHDRAAARYVARADKGPGLSQEALDAVRLMMITAQLLVETAAGAELLRMIDRSALDEPPATKGTTP